MIEKVIEIISEYQGINPETVTENSDLIADLNLSSFDVVALACEFEDTFEVEIPDRKIRELKTIKDIVLFIKKEKK